MGGKHEAVEAWCSERAVSVFEQTAQPIQAHPVQAAALAAGGVVALVLLARWLRRAAPLAFAALYTRLSRSDVTGHPRRAALLDAIRTTPGIGTAELGRTLDLSPGTLGYHLRTLEKAGLVKSLLAGRDRLWFEAGAKAPAPGELSLLDPSRRAIHETVTREPGLSQTDLARRLDMALPTVHHHVKALAETGAVDVRRDGAATRVFAREAPRFSLRPPG
jgi:predicted transcriptional regulator